MRQRRHYETGGRHDETRRRHNKRPVATYISRMFAIVQPEVIVLCSADAISDAGTCRENAYFYHYKGSNRILSMIF